MYHLNVQAYQSAFQTHEVRQLDKIQFKTEELIVGDPFLLPLEEHLPFLHRVPKGEYYPEIAIKTLENGDKRVNFARIVFSEKTPVYWEMGLTWETINEEFSEGEFTGAVSETGYLCFCDVRAMNGLPNQPKTYNQFENDLLKTLKEKEVKTYAYATKKALACFTAGWGEGLYPVFFGYEKEPSPNEALFPVCVVVDLLLD